MKPQRYECVSCGYECMLNAIPDEWHGECPVCHSHMRGPDDMNELAGEPT